MPRGRAGLTLISATRVKKAQGFQSARWCARYFGVTERSWRRWCRKGLPLYYGSTRITQEWWDAFEQRNQLDLFPSTTRTSVDRQLSAAGKC